MTKIAVLSIGTELLKGSTINTNASYMGQQMRKAGYLMNETLVVHDAPDQLRRSLNFLLDHHDVVLTTGGLGPTTDDLTKEILREYFGGEMVRHEPTWEHIRSFFERKGRKVNPSNEQQAFVPDSCEVVFNPLGTAPGMHFESDGKHLFALPGVPFEMKNLLDTEVIPFLLKNFPPDFQHSEMIRTFGISESAAAEKIKVLWSELPKSVEKAYLPSVDGLKMELTIRGTAAEREQLENDLAKTKSLILESFGKYVYAEEDKKLQEVLGDLMKEYGTTVGTAESMTGGTIAKRIVSVSGASAYFRGGVVAYHREVKEEVLGVSPETIDSKGVVSAETVEEMAKGTREVMKTDFAIATTGNAEENPTDPYFRKKGVWIGIATPDGVFSEFYPLFHTRSINIERATYAALAFGWKYAKQFLEKDDAT